MNLIDKTKQLCLFKYNRVFHSVPLLLQNNPLGSLTPKVIQNQEEMNKQVLFTDVYCNPLKLFTTI